MDILIHFLLWNWHTIRTTVPTMNASWLQLPPPVQEQARSSDVSVTNDLALYEPAPLKGLYVTFRNCLLTTVAVQSTAVSVLLLALCGSEPPSVKTVWHTWDWTWLTRIMLTACFSIKLLKNVNSSLNSLCCLSGFHVEAQPRQQSYISWKKTLMVSESDGILQIRPLV